MPPWHGQEHTPPCRPGVHAVQDADLDDDDLADEQFEKELEAMAQYGSEDEDPRSFAALHKRLAAQRGADAAAGGARVLPCLALRGAISAGTFQCGLASSIRGLLRGSCLGS